MRDLGVAGVRHRDEVCARLRPAGAADPLAGGVGMARQPPLVDLLGDEAAEVGMHAPGDRQQDAAVGRHGGVVAEQPVEAGEAGGAGMRALHHLRQLARVADQHDVAGAAAHGEQVGEPDLPGLVDDERVEGARELGPAEVEGGAADHVRAAPEDVVGPARSAHRRPRVVGIVAGPELVGNRDVLEREARRVVRQRLEAGAQDVADRLVAGRGHRHPAAGSDEGEDRPRRDVGLAGAGRSLDRQYALLQREDGAQRARDRVGPAEDVGGRPAVEPRRPAREQVVEGADAARAALVGDRRPHRRREAARVERPRRMQREPVGQLDAAAGADLHRGGAGLAVERGEPEGDVRLAERRGRRAPGLQPGLLLREAIVADDRLLLGPRRSDRLEAAEAVEVVDELVGVPPEAVEDRPVCRLRLAPVEKAEVEEQPLPLRVEARGGELSPERRRLGVLLRLVAAPVGRERRPRSGGPDRDQPVAQLLGRDAVDAVVVLDLVEDRLVAFLEPALVGDDRAAGGLHLAGALDAGEDLERLDRIVGLGREHPAAHHRVEVDEAPLAQQPVEKRLADPVQRRQPAQRRHLVGRVVIDARSRMRRDPRPEGVEHGLERRPLRVAVVRPDRAEAEVRRPEPVQVLEPALDVRIALDVVEDVARIGRRQQVEALARQGGPQRVGRPAGGARGLEPGLRHQPRQRLGRHAAHRLGPRRERRHRRDPGGLQLRDLAAGDVGDAERLSSPSSRVAQTSRQRQSGQSAQGTGRVGCGSATKASSRSRTRRA